MDGARCIETIKVTNLLSFGPEAEEVELQPLNVLIGPNGSGKSNFLESLALLRKIPSNLAHHFHYRGGPSQWIYRGGAADRAACISVAISHPAGRVALGHRLKFNFNDGELYILEETVRNAESGAEKPITF
ncbi:MAG TPA: AAA family ATPase [Planctomycetaceae bacterium]|nr:AAA family ATPase [Planctomycetaceae bacterium]